MAAPKLNPVAEPRGATVADATDLMHYFDYDHLPADLQEVSKRCADLADTMYDTLPHNAMFNEGLKWLLLAKDAFVRADVREKK